MQKEVMVAKDCYMHTSEYVRWVRNPHLDLPKPIMDGLKFFAGTRMTLVCLESAWGKVPAKLVCRYNGMDFQANKDEVKAV